MDNDHQDLIAENVRLFARIIELEREQARITAAAEVGDKDDIERAFEAGSKHGGESVKAATIERCAQKLDAVARTTTMDVAKTAFEEAAAIIRALAK